MKTMASLCNLDAFQEAHSSLSGGAKTEDVMSGFLSKLDDDAFKSLSDRARVEARLLKIEESEILKHGPLSIRSALFFSLSFFPPSLGADSIRSLEESDVLNF